MHFFCRNFVDKKESYMNFKAALFDLDGVVFDTETQYTKFWGEQGRRYHPEMPDFHNRIKGMTLVQIYDQYFAGQTEVQHTISQALNDFEAHMSYDYIAGAHDYVVSLRQQGIKTAVVTSSNLAKMSQVYRQHPDFKSLFNAVLTSENIRRSKPAPDGYLQAAELLGEAPADCVGFEDSVNGMRSIKAAGIYLVGLVTTNPREVVAQYADVMIDDFTHGVDIKQ